MTTLGPATRDSVATARRAVLDVVGRELAVAPLELQARLCEHQHPGLPHRLDPFDVQVARDDLEATGQLARSSGRPAQGSWVLSVLVEARPADPERTAAAAAHRRELVARHQSWTGPAGPVAGAAQQVVHESFQVAAPAGYQVAPTSPLDVVVHTPSSGRAVLIPLQVDNTREWLVPHARTVYPLLRKAVDVQHAEPAAAIMPLFVCRRAHPRLVAMGRDLGFVVIETRREFISPSVSETAVAEVRSTLAFTDLVRTDTYDPLLVSRLGQIVPGLAQPLAERWRRTTATEIPALFDALVAEAGVVGRRRLVRDVRATAAAHGLVGSPGW